MQPHSVRFRLVKRVLTVTAAALLLLIPWLLIQYVNQFQFWLSQPRPEALSFWTLHTLKRLVSMICYFVVGWLPGMTFTSVLGLILLGLYAASALTLHSVARRHEIQPTLTFGSVLLLMPILFVIGVEVILNDSGLLLFPRFALPALTGLCLLFGLAIVCSHRRTLSVLIAAMIVVPTGYFQWQWSLRREIVTMGQWLRRAGILSGARLWKRAQRGGSLWNSRISKFTPCKQDANWSRPMSRRAPSPRPPACGRPAVRSCAASKSRAQRG